MNTARARAIEREEVWQLEIPRWKYRVGSTALILCFGKMMAAEAATDIVFRVRYQAAAPPADRRGTDSLVKFFVKIVKIVKKVGLDVTKVGLGVTKKAFPAGSPVCISRMVSSFSYCTMKRKNCFVICVIDRRIRTSSFRTMERKPVFLLGFFVTVLASAGKLLTD